MTIDFDSCFAHGGTFGKEGTCGKDGRFSKMGSEAGNRDKILKAAIQITRFAQEVSREVGATEATVNGLGTASSALGDGRAILGIMNPISGISNMVSSLIEFRDYWHGSKKKKDVNGNDIVKDGEIQYVDGLERVLGIISSAFKFAEWALFNFIFGVVSPISFAGKHFQLGETAKGIGSQFSLFMMMRDITTAAHTIAEIGVKNIQYRELIKGADKDLKKYLDKAYFWTNVKSGLGLVKNGCDIASASIGFGGYKVSKWTVLGLGLVSAAIGLTEVGWGTSPLDPTKFPPGPRPV